MNTKAKQLRKYAMPFVAIMAVLLAFTSPAVTTAPLDDELFYEMEDRGMDPVVDGYLADDTKMNIYEQGFIRGDLNYTYGEPFYKCIWNYNLTTGTNETATYNINIDIPPEKIKSARLYVYWTWSTFDEYEPYSSKDYGVYPALNVTFNSVPVSFNYAPGTNWIDNYTDSKNNTLVGVRYGQPNYVKYNFPGGTNCSMVDRELVGANNVVNVTNVYPYYGDNASTTGTDRAKVCIQGVGLLVAYESDTCKKYWIAEGNDMTYVRWDAANCNWKYNITAEMATTKVKFPGPVPFWMNKATLTSVIPTGDSVNNTLYFNNFYNYWTGLWNCTPSEDLSVSETDVSENLLRGWIPKYDNVAGFRNGIYGKTVDWQYSPPGGDRQMNVANAFLVVEYDPATLADPDVRALIDEIGIEELQKNELKKELDLELRNK